MPLPISNLKMQDVYEVLYGTSGINIDLKELCRSEYVNIFGLDPTYCPGDDPWERGDNLVNQPHHLSYFRNYDHDLTTTTTTTTIGYYSIVLKYNISSSSNVCQDLVTSFYYTQGQTYNTLSDIVTADVFLYSDTGGTYADDGYYSDGITYAYYSPSMTKWSDTGNCTGTTTTTTTTTPTYYSINCYDGTTSCSANDDRTVYVTNSSVTTISSAYTNSETIYSNTSGTIAPARWYADDNPNTYSYEWGGAFGWLYAAGCGTTTTTSSSTTTTTTTTTSYGTIELGYYADDGGRACIANKVTYYTANQSYANLDAVISAGVPLYSDSSGTLASDGYYADAYDYGYHSPSMTIWSDLGSC